MSAKERIIIATALLLPLLIASPVICLKVREKWKCRRVCPVKLTKPDPRKCEHPDGIDLSHHNQAYDWSKVTAKFCYVRTTMGSSIVDKSYDQHRGNAAKHKIPMGAYHFLTAKTDAKTQFGFFSSRVKKKHLQLRPMLDIEDSNHWNAPKGFTGNDARKLIREWCDLCKKAYGAAPIIYITEALYKKYGMHKGFEDCIWWVANYNNIDNYEKKCIIPYTIHQYSDKKNVEGFYGNVDCNTFAKGKTVKDLLICKR